MPKVLIRDHGPILVEALEGESLVLVDGKGAAFGLGERRIVALCRCGASKNKPFCDGSHGPSGFRSEVEARDLAGPKPAGS